MGDRTCSCVNAEDENLTPGTRCCACRAFYKLALPLGSEQRCPCGHVRGHARIQEPPKETIWQRIRWWWIWRIWNPLRGRCSWCGRKMVDEDDPRADDGDHDTYGMSLGWGATACQGCIEYGDG